MRHLVALALRADDRMNKPVGVNRSFQFAHRPWVLSKEEAEALFVREQFRGVGCRASQDSFDLEKANHKNTLTLPHVRSGIATF